MKSSTYHILSQKNLYMEREITPQAFLAAENGRNINFLTGVKNIAIAHNKNLYPSECFNFLIAFLSLLGGILLTFILHNLGECYRLEHYQNERVFLWVNTLHQDVIYAIRVQG